MDNNEEVNKIKAKKKCFVITPIGAPNSDIRRKIDGVISSAIKPVLNGKYEVIVSHEETNSGSIKSSIIKNIYDCDLVIANLTTQNPNVMYEVAIRHAVAKPIIHITEDVKDLPFDINDQRTIEYKDDMYGVIELRDKLDKMVSDIETSTEKISNPVVDSLKITNIINVQENNMDISDAIITMLSQLKEVNSRVSLIEREVNNSKKQLTSEYKLNVNDYVLPSTVFFKSKLDANVLKDDFVLNSDEE